MRIFCAVVSLLALCSPAFANTDRIECREIQSSQYRLECHLEKDGDDDCGSRPNSDEQIQCFDQIYPKLRPLEAVRLREQLGQIDEDAVPRSNEGWRLLRTTSPFTDRYNFQLTQESNMSVSCGILRESKKISLVIRCKENTTSIFLDTHCHLASGFGGYGDVDLRVDDEPAFRRSMEESTNNSALGLWKGRSSIPLIRNHLIGGEELVVRFTPFSENPLTARFNLKDLERMVQPLREECGW